MNQATRWLAGVLAIAGGITGCRDLTFGGKRIADDHVLAGRSVAEGGDELTVVERDQGWFVSTDAGLERLQTDLRTRLDLQLGLKSLLRGYASGEARTRDPRLATPTLTTTTSTLATPVIAPVDLATILRKDENNPGELQALCAHPVLKTYIGSGCDGLGSISDIPMDDLEIDVDQANISVTWDQPRHVARIQHASDEAGSCTGAIGALEKKCKESFVCPKNAADQEIAGTCVWGRECTNTADCNDTACEKWGGCVAPAGESSGVCNQSAGLCSSYLDLVEEESDGSATAPVLRVRVPLSLELDPNDIFGAFISVDLNTLVVDLRLQPRVCKDDNCRAFGRVAFSGYSPQSVVFSNKGVDVHARSQMVSRDYSIDNAGCAIPGAELAISPFVPLPPGAGAGACFIFAAEGLPGMIDRGLANASSGLGRLADRMFNPAPFVVPTDGLPDWLELDASRVFSTTPDGHTLPLASADGAWTNQTVELLAKGATHSYIRVDLNGSPVSDACTNNPGLTQCRDLCDGRSVPCDLSNAKVCLHFYDAGECDGGLRLRANQFKTVLQVARTATGATTPTDDEIDQMIVKIRDTTAPIPAVPQLAALLDASPFAAKTIQSVFTKPLEEAFDDDDATFTDIVYCPASGTRPAECPSGANGPVFRFKLDSDGDGIRDQDDVCPNSFDPANIDTDSDSFCDASDYCPWTPSISNTLQYCNCDVDFDGCPNELLGTPILGAPYDVPSSCPTGHDGIWDENPLVSDGGENTDRAAEYPWATNDCDGDDDNDNYLDADDNCPSIANDQADQNKDGTGNACDPLCPGSGAPCPSPELNDPSLLPMGLVDFDFGARLIPGCFAGGPQCWGFFRVSCQSYGASGSCDGGSEIARWSAPTGAQSAFLSPTFDVGSISTLGEFEKDGVPYLLISGTSGKAPALAAIDGTTGKTLWQLAASSTIDITSVALGPTYIAIGAPEYSPKNSGASHGAVQLISFSGELMGEPIVGDPGERFGSMITFTGGMTLVGAPGKIKPKKPGSGRIYAVVPTSKKPLLVLDGDAAKAHIGDTAPVAMTFGKKDALVVPAGGTLLVIQRLPNKYGQLGATLKTITTGTSGPLSLSQLADFDGDGVKEFAVGVPSQSKGAGTIGFVSENGTLRGSGLLGKSDFGTQVVALGDLDGDGASELGVGLPDTKIAGAPFPGAFAVLTKLSKLQSFTPK